jgi:hypothetical protein
MSHATGRAGTCNSMTEVMVSFTNETSGFGTGESLVAQHLQDYGVTSVRSAKQIESLLIDEESLSARKRGPLALSFDEIQPPLVMNKPCRRRRDYRAKPWDRICRYHLLRARRALV